ncbi:class I tRNA ligase family protein, partial [Kitasatospora sp. NPDC004799]|uniref:class I tRNA ligase family protein n=1 Tax=Kitasatospora sp. NPDC004799 TaxID=3154460 RepID=UPI0033A5EF33
FNWLTYYGGKFSTSQKRGVFTDVALELLPADYWRYFLLAHAPESDDSSFTWELFASVVNKDLADTLGNFVNRVLTFSRKRFGEEVPGGHPPGEAEQRLGEQVAGLLAEYEAQLDGLNFRKAAQALRALWSAGNAYLDEKAPWLQVKTDPEAAALTLRTAMNLVHLYAVVSEPFVPGTAAAVRGAFALPEDSPAATRDWVSPEEARTLDLVPAGTAFTVPPVLFAKITDEELAAWTARFGGSADERGAPR